jgi:hypothetical protein
LDEGTFGRFAVGTQVLIKGGKGAIPLVARMLLST